MPETRKTRKTRVVPDVRDMHDILDIVPQPSRAKLLKRPQLAWINPMLATLAEQRQFTPGWVFERKFDGVRCLIFRKGDEVRIMSRNRKPMTAGYPELVDAMLAQPVDDFIVDGEVVAFEGEATSFGRLQGRLGIRDAARALATGIHVHLYLFDLLHVEGHDTTALPLLDRKAVLEHVIDYRDPVRYSAHLTGDGELYARSACEHGWEGLIAKRIDSTYQPARSRDWLKLKCLSRQEFVVVGYTDPQRSRIGFGALLVGYYQGGELRYAGKVGTGYDAKTLRDLHQRLFALERPTPAVKGAPRFRDAHWVRPDLVCEVGFSEWTGEGLLRHPRFLGLRHDKPPRQVTRESPHAPAA